MKNQYQCLWIGIWSSLLYEGRRIYLTRVKKENDSVSSRSVWFREFPRVEIYTVTGHTTPSPWDPPALISCQQSYISLSRPHLFLGWLQSFIAIGHGSTLFSCTKSYFQLVGGIDLTENWVTTCFRQHVSSSKKIILQNRFLEEKQLFVWTNQSPPPQQSIIFFDILYTI